MANDDAATATVNQPGHAGERLPRPLKRWRLFVADKRRARLLMQSPRNETQPARPAREPDGRSSAGNATSPIHAFGLPVARTVVVSSHVAI